MFYKNISILLIVVLLMTQQACRSVIREDFKLRLIERKAHDISSAIVESGYTINELPHKYNGLLKVSRSFNLEKSLYEDDGTPVFQYTPRKDIILISHKYELGYDDELYKVKVTKEFKVFRFCEDTGKQQEYP